MMAAPGIFCPFLFWSVSSLPFPPQPLHFPQVLKCLTRPPCVSPWEVLTYPWEVVHLGLHCCVEQHVSRLGLAILTTSQGEALFEIGITVYLCDDSLTLMYFIYIHVYMQIYYVIIYIIIYNKILIIYIQILRLTACEY